MYWIVYWYMKCQLNIDVTDDDPRKYFYDSYSRDFNKIFDGTDPSFSDYDLILTDDNRVSSKTNLEKIYRQKKGTMLSCFRRKYK